MNTHSYGLLDALYLLVRLGREWFDGNGESLGQLLVPLCFNLRTHHFLWFFGGFDRRLSNNGLRFCFAGGG
jgi:hypothetical protein